MSLEEKNYIESKYTQSYLSYPITPELKEALVLSAHCCTSAYRYFDEKGPLNLPQDWDFEKGFTATVVNQGENKVEKFAILAHKAGSNDYMLAIRGVEDWQDLVSVASSKEVDFYLYESSLPSGAHVSQGPNTVYTSMRDSIMDSLVKINTEQGIDHLYIAGHSAGAYMTKELALDVMSCPALQDPISGKVGFALNIHPIAPIRGTDQNFVTAYSDLMVPNQVFSLAILNDYDLVTKYPIDLPWDVPLPYEKHIQFGEKWEIFSNHSIVNYTKAIEALPVDSADIDGLDILASLHIA